MEDDKKPTYSFWPQLPKLVCVSCAHFTRGMCLEHNKPVRMTEKACGDFGELSLTEWGNGAGLQVACGGCAYFKNSICVKNDRPTRAAYAACGDFKELDMKAWGQDE